MWANVADVLLRTQSWRS